MYRLSEKPCFREQFESQIQLMHCDDEMIIEDLDAWEYLQDVGYFDIKDTTDYYLYSEDELKELGKRYYT